MIYIYIKEERKIYEERENWKKYNGNEDNCPRYVKSEREKERYKEKKKERYIKRERENWKKYR